MHNDGAAVAPEPTERGGARNRLIRELYAAGVKLRIGMADGKAYAHGESMRLDTRGISGTDSFRLIDALADNKPVSVMTILPHASLDALGLFYTFCRQLRSLLLDNGIDPRQVGLVVDAEQIRPGDAWRVRRNVLGPGCLHVVVDADLPQRDWLELWEYRHIAGLRTVVSAHANSSNPLLSAEPAHATLPDLVLRAPDGTAWTPLEVDLSCFIDARGKFRSAALDRALVACVEIGDLLHDELPRFSSVTRHDAWFNRRLSIEVSGIGDLARLRNIEPRSLAALDELRDLLGSIRHRLHVLSVGVARRRGIVPSLRETDPTRRLPAGARYDDWRMRWRRAVDAAAVRHRNLLTMSPWSILATAQECDLRYVDLLPLIEIADALSFRRKVSLADWNVNEFRQFHERARAVLHKRNASCVFAQRV